MAETKSLIVTTAEDKVDPEDGVTSLREAIAYAESLYNNAVVSFADDFEIELKSTLSITKNITINGEEKKIKIIGSTTFPMFAFTGSALNLNNLILHSDYSGDDAGIININKTCTAVYCNSIQDEGSANLLWRTTDYTSILYFNNDSHVHNAKLIPVYAPSEAGKIYVDASSSIENVEVFGQHYRSGGDFNLSGTVKNVIVNKDADFYLLAGSSAENVILTDSGHALQDKDSTIKNLSVELGSVYFYKLGVTLDGDISIGGCFRCSDETIIPSSIVTDISEITFALNSRNPESTVDFGFRGKDYLGVKGNRLVDSMAALDGAKEYTISVKAEQTLGTYQLAGNAAEFSYALSLTVGENTYTDVLTIGNTYTVGGKDYTLVLNDDSVLALNIAETKSLIVTTALDVVDAYDGVTSLREALAAAASDSSLKKDGKYTITFDDSIFTDDSATITLNSTLEIGESIFTGEYGELVIQGTEGKSVILDGNSSVQIISNAAGNIVTLSDMIFSNGYGIINTPNSFVAGAVLNAGTMILNAVTLENNYANGGYCCHAGGAIANITTGSLTIYNSALLKNAASTDGGSYNLRSGVAGAIVNAGTLSIDSATIEGNNVSISSSSCRDIAGGIINMVGASLSVGNTEFISNTTTVNASGINDAAGGLMNKGTAIISTSEFIGNNTSGHANIFAGAIMQTEDSSLVINKSTFRKNQCIASTVWGAVGGIHVRGSGKILVTNSLLENNTGTSVGAISITESTSGIIDNTTFYENSSNSTAGIYTDSSVTILNSTLANNRSITLKNDNNLSVLNSIISSGNISGTISLSEGMLTENDASPEQIFSEVDENGNAVLNEDGTIHLKIDGAADGTGVYVWHNEDYSSIAYSETYYGEKTAVIGNIEDATILSSDQLGYTRNIYDTDIGARLADTEKVIYTLSDSVNAKYDGSAKTVSVSVTSPAAGAAVSYSIDGKKTWQSGSSYSLTDVGNAEVWFRIEAKGYATVETEARSIAIAKRNVTLTSDSTSKKYDGSALTGTVTVSGDGFVSGEATATASSITDAGTATNTITVHTGSGYKASNYNITKLEGTLSVIRRDVTLTSADDSKKYDGKPLTNNTVTVSGDGFADGEGATYTVTGSQTEVGSSANTFTCKLNPNTKAANYNVTTQAGTLTVNPAMLGITITAESLSKTYDGQVLTAPKYSWSGELLKGDTLTATVSGSITDAGTAANKIVSYKIMRGTEDVTDEYVVHTLDGTLTVNKRDVTLTSDSSSKKYDGSALTGTVTVSGDGFVAGEATATAASITDAGTVTNTININAGTGYKAANYNITKLEGTLTVNKRDVTLTSDSSSKKYDGSALTGNVTVSGDGFVAGEATATASSITDAGTVTNTITVSTGSGYKDANYNITKFEGTLSVTRRDVTLTSADDRKNCDGLPLTNSDITIGGDGFTDGEGADYTVTGSQTNIGSSTNTFTYTLNADTKADNYNITKKEGTLTVNNIDPLIIKKDGKVTISEDADYRKVVLCQNAELTIAADTAFGADEISLAEGAELTLSKDQYDLLMKHTDFADDFAGKLHVVYSIGNALCPDDIDILMNKANVNSVAFEQNLIDVNKLHFKAAKATTVSFADVFGTKRNDTIRFDKNTNITFGAQGREINLEKGSNKVQIDQNAVTTILANLTNISSVKAAKGSVVTMADISFQTDRNATLKADGISFTAERIDGTSKNSSITIGKGTRFQTGDITLNGKSDRISVGTNAYITAGNVSGADSVRLGSGSKTTFGTLSGVSTLNLASGKSALTGTALDVRDISGSGKSLKVTVGNFGELKTASITGTAGNDALKVGNNASARIAQLDLRSGKDSITIGNNSEVTIIADSAQSLTKFTIGKNTVAWLSEALAEFGKLKLGKDSEIHVIEEETADDTFAAAQSVADDFDGILGGGVDNIDFFNVDDYRSIDCAGQEVAIRLWSDEDTSVAWSSGMDISSYAKFSVALTESGTEDTVKYHLLLA